MSKLRLLLLIAKEGCNTLLTQIDCTTNCPIEVRPLDIYRCIEESQYNAQILLKQYSDTEIFEELL